MRALVLGVLWTSTALAVGVAALDDDAANPTRAPIDAHADARTIDPRTIDAPMGRPVPIPPLTGPVIDAAGIIGSEVRARLENLARRAHETAAGVQLQILTVPSLGGDSIEDFSMRAAETYKLGTKGKDNGLLMVVAPTERRVRIEVGGGLEGGLTDAQAGRIIHDTLAPAFREGRYGEGIYAASQQSLAVLGSLPSDEAALETEPVERPHRPRLSMGMILIIIVLLFTLLPRLLGFGRRRSMWGGPFIGGGGWSGGRGGGGWGGGGGGFSGGGASGNW